MDAAIAAAPYVHPKLQAIAIRPGDAALTQEERDRQQTTRRSCWPSWRCWRGRAVDARRGI